MGLSRQHPLQHGGLRLVRPELCTAIRRDLPRQVDVFGAGRAVRAMLTVAALQGSTVRFRIWCRHHARAELLRIHLADLPPLAAQIIVANQPERDGTGPLVLALGRRTSRKSRQRSKDALFAENMAIIEAMMPVLAGRSVIVVTNPSTRLTARLLEHGVHALGIGVMNDQLRFERDAPAQVRLVGAHNPFELGFGLLGRADAGQMPGFSRSAYRDLTNRQDRQRPLLDPDGVLARVSPALHEGAWRDLGALHDTLDVAQRWYARQRLASRYLENGIACGRAILSIVDFLTGEPMKRADLTVETAMRIGSNPPCVMGWPLDVVTGQPRGLGFDDVSLGVIDELASTYQANHAAPEARQQHEQVWNRLALHADGVTTIACEGTGLDELTGDLVPLVHVTRVNVPQVSGVDQAAGTSDITVRLLDHPDKITPFVSDDGAMPVSIAQHRGKNAFEHRDLTITALPGGRRFARFSTSGAVALIDDQARQITLAVAPGAARRDEFRKLLRDQILTPAHAAAGAWVLHAGLVSHDGAGLLLIGDSGAGKTTGALHLLGGADGASGYGASERVLVFVRDGKLMALGVPESITVFRGSLRGLRGFADLVAGHDADADWIRDRKIRLSRDEVVARLGSFQITEPVRIRQVALVCYAPYLDAEAEVADLHDPKARIAALHANDLTTEDDVRAAWLGWFEPQRDPHVLDLMAERSLPFDTVRWRVPSALSGMLARNMAAVADRDSAP